MAKKQPPVASKPPSEEDPTVFAAPAQQDLTQPPNLVPEPKPVWIADNQAHLDLVFDEIANGSSMREIAAMFVGLSVNGILKLIDRDDDTQKRYARAKEAMAHQSAQQIAVIARDVLKGRYAPDAARVALDGLKWSASKLLPRFYGDKVELGGTLNISLVQALTDLSAQPVAPPPALPEK